MINKAIARRFNRIPFSVTIAADQINKNLAEELKQERCGILAWMIEGCLEWQKIGLCPPKVVTDATESYLDSQDVLGEWLDQCWKRDAHSWASSTDFFNSWKPWAEERQEWVGSVKTLTTRLEDRGLNRCRNKELTKHGFSGWKLKQPVQTEKVLWMYVQKETFGGNGVDHEGAVLVTLDRQDQDGVWLPKSKIKQGEKRPDGRVEITMPMWLAKDKELDQAESAPESATQAEIPF